MIRFDILTVFPEMFASVLGCSLLKKASDRGVIDIRLHDIRSHTEDKHRMTDDAPYAAGGDGHEGGPHRTGRSNRSQNGRRCAVNLLTPQGEPFRQRTAEKLALYPQLILLCGHYEGVDERVRAHLVTREISIGDYVLTGGELSAMVVVDAVSRLIPGSWGTANPPAPTPSPWGFWNTPTTQGPPSTGDGRSPRSSFRGTTGRSRLGGGSNPS